jgi:hypothetical protein
VALVADFQRSFVVAVEHSCRIVAEDEAAADSCTIGRVVAAERRTVVEGLAAGNRGSCVELAAAAVGIGLEETAAVAVVLQIVRCCRMSSQTFQVDSAVTDEKDLRDRMR